MKASILFSLLSGIFLSHSVSVESNDNSSLPFNADFGSVKDYPLGTLEGHRSWRVEQGHALIQEAEGGRSLVIPPTVPHGQASVYFTPPVGKGALFIDLTLRMGAGAEGLEVIDANGALAGLVRVDEEGRLMVRDWQNATNGSWLDTTVRVPLDGSGAMREWTRLTLRQDPTAATWDLYVDGVMKGGNLGLLPDERETGGYFTLMGSETHEILLKRLSVDGKNPLFEDTNLDGLPDDWQKKLGRGGREDDPDADGLTNLEEFIFGTKPLKADSDGDGMTDAEEISSGRDPFKADASNRKKVTSSFWKAGDIALPVMPSNLYKARQHGVFKRNAEYELPLDRLEFSGLGLNEEDYVSRTRGWIVPPVTGTYTFWVSGDDVAEFWLSTDDTPFLRKQVAKAARSTGNLNFDSSGPQRSKEISLVAGQRYYFEIQQKEASEDDHFAVAWQIPGKRRAVIGGSFLEAWVPDPRDANDDCLPDDWQNTYQLHAKPANADPQADPDGDRLSNAEEYRLGSNPMNPDAEGRPGLITRELWFGIPGRYLLDSERAGSFPRNPSWTEYLESFEGPRNVGSNYLARIYGFVRVPETGTYRFHISGDDQAALWLGTGADKFTRRKIASVPVRSGWHKWNQFPSQTSEALSLTKGQILYIEARHKQGEGDDYVAVAWTRPGSQGPEIIGTGDLIAWKPQADDSDGNDLPDSWQNTRRLEANGKRGPESNFKLMSAYGDADKDGVSNEAERVAGTDPLDASSHPENGLALQFWDDRPGQDLSGLDQMAGFPAQPSRSKVLTDMDYANEGQNYLARARGFVVAPATADYFFSIAGADNCQLWLSTDESRFKKQLIAEVALATAWRNRTLNKDQQSARIRLEAGKKYYIETLHKKGSGKDHLTVSWMIPGVWQTVILQDFLRPYRPDAADADDDGLPDTWEATHHLDSKAPSGRDGAWGDPDGDLLTNFAEFQHGTDPHREDSSKLPGLALWEVWDSITGLTVDRLTGHPRFPAQPSHRSLLENTTVPSDRGSWYGGRLRGYLVPPVSGQYRLLVSGDDQVALYVSSSESKFDRKLVAGTPLWTNERDFTRYSAQGATLDFEAGKLYFFELIHKEHTGRDHAAVAWLAPGSKKPAVLSGKSIAAFRMDPADLDDDELPDSWENIHQLDSRDNGNTDPQQGPWGDPDADKLRNLDEWRLGTDPNNSDSDGDGLDDGTEHYLTGSNPREKNDLALTRIASLSAQKAATIRGRTELVEGGLKSGSQSGTLSFSFELPEDGIPFLQLEAYLVPAPSGVPTTLVVRIDGMNLGVFPLRQFSDKSGQIYGRLPKLRKGSHTLEISWALPNRATSILFEDLRISLLPGKLPADEGANLVLSTATESLTSPFCFEGKATFFPLVQVSPAAALRPLPDKGWYGDIPLPEDGSPLEVKTQFENGLLEESRVISWKSCDILSSGDLLIRAGDSLRLTALVDTKSEIQILVDGVLAAVVNSPVAAPHAFTKPGTYRVTASCSDPQNPINKTIQVTVLQAEIPTRLQMLPAQERELILPGLPLQAEAVPDASLHFMEVPDSAPRRFVATQQDPGSALVAFRLPQNGPVLRTLELSNLTLLSDLDTWYGATYDQDGNKIFLMDVFAPGMEANLRLKLEILAPGVVFEDGTSVKWLIPEDFNEHDIATVRFFILNSLSTSFCHRITIYDGDTIIGVRE